MKCLEFLYFYLLDETEMHTLQQPQPSPKKETPPAFLPTTPTTPMRGGSSKKPFFASVPRRPVSRYGSSTYAFSSSSPSGLTATDASSSSSRSTSSSSFSSTSSNASSSTTPSTRPSTPQSPKKSSSFALPSVKTPQVVTKVASAPQVFHLKSSSISSFPQTPKPRSLLMLKKDVDYVPESPLKMEGPAKEHNHHIRGKSLSAIIQAEPPSARVRTTEEKKELLGTLLGNVDALVDGVRKAGIWGLG